MSQSRILWRGTAAQAAYTADLVAIELERDQLRQDLDRLLAAIGALPVEAEDELNDLYELAQEIAEKGASK